MNGIRRWILPSNLSCRVHLFRLETRKHIWAGNGCSRNVFRSRYISSANSNSPTTPTLLPILSFLLGSLATAGLGFYYLESRNAFTSHFNRAGKDPVTEPNLGSAYDFQNAIRQLQLAFPEEDRVTTAPEDLYDHGFSTVRLLRAIAFA